MHQGSRAWTAFSVGGLVAWIGAIVVVTMRSGNPSDGRSARHAFAIGGAVYFGLLFGGAALALRRSKGRRGSRLYEQLAIGPVSDSSLRRATAPMYRIGNVYISFGAVLTALGLAAAAVDEEQRSGQLLRVAAVLVVVWVAYAAYALRKSFTITDSVVSPLGLVLTGIPSFHYSWLADRGYLIGAVTYSGERRGRRVEITQHPKLAVTVVSGVAGRPRPPSSPVEMSELTGESPMTWRAVSVTVEDDAVTVERNRNGAGAWFLQDLLLAEAIADRN